MRHDLGGAAWRSVADDNRQRVYIDGGVGGTWRAQVFGRDVQTNTSPGQEGCSADENRVYWAVRGEDNARNDDAELSTYVRPEDE